MTDKTPGSATFSGAWNAGSVPRAESMTTSATRESSSERSGSEDGKHEDPAMQTSVKHSPGAETPEQVLRQLIDKLGYFVDTGVQARIVAQYAMRRAKRALELLEGRER